MSEVSYRFLNATKDLVAFCDQARQAGWLALDTEFVRERTYYAQLGLLQLAIDGDVVLLDPQQNVDLEPLWELIADPQTIKVLHAGSEDLELLFQSSGRIPQNFFDSQIAATVLGHGNSMGYAPLVQQYCNMELDKTQSRTDWLARPLSSEQLYYAAADVFYLAQIYPQLLAELVAADKLDLVADECALQIAKRTRSSEPVLAWRDLGNAWQCTDQQRAVLQELATWRLQTARSKDKPLGFIIKDAALIEIARREADSLSKLAAIDDMHPQTIRRFGEGVVSAVQRGLAIPAAQIPAPMPRLDFEPGYKAVFKKIKTLVQEQADAFGVPPPFLGSRKQINELFHWFWFADEALRARLHTPDLLIGWRGSLLKNRLEALLLPRP